jgi:L-iditol 2-dehydrogenase
MVIGAGVIGLIIIQALKIYGCDNIISVDVDTNRLEVAKYYGATILINSRENDVKRIIKNNYLEEIDLAFEAVGIDETVNLSIESVKKNGRIVLVGNVMPNVRIPLQKIVTRELKITGSCAIAGEYPLVIKDLSEKKLDFEKIITSTARLIDGKDWFEKLHSGSHNEIKVILNP